MKRTNQGFTLVELAIVLVIIGLILGMAFKGKDLIDGAKVKSMAAQYNKVIAAENIFYEKYGFYPGDGCAAAAPATVAACNGAKDGRLGTANERLAFWFLLTTRTNIIPASEQRSVFGQNWNVTTATLTSGTVDTDWMSLPTAGADARYMCALDQVNDDGLWNTGKIQLAAATAAANQYNASPTAATPTDCWTLSGQVTPFMQLLP